MSDTALPEAGRPSTPGEGATQKRVERSARFTWTVFWCVVVLLAAYVLAFQDAVPYYDDWSVALVTAERRELTLDWLWAQHNEHRMPLSRLILYGSFRGLGLDPRPPMMLSVIFLSAAAALLLWTCRDLRGSFAPQDVAIPLLLAGLGQYYNALWAFQVALTAAAFLFALALRCMVRATVADRPGASLLAGLAAVLLPTTGVSGVVLGIAVAAWCLWRALRLLTRHRGWSRLAGLLLLGVPFVVGGYSILYLQHLERSVPPAENVATFIESLAGVATVGLGPATPADLPWGWGLLALAAFGGAAISWRILRHPADREPSIALLLGMIAGWGVIAAVAYGRGSMGTGATMVPRYVLLGSLGIATLYLVGVRLEAQRLGYLLTIPLLVGTLYRQPSSVAAARDHGIERSVRGRAFAADVLAGERLQTLVRRHGSYFTENVTLSQDVASWITALDSKRAGPFAPPSPRLDTRPEALREIEVPLTPVRVSSATMDSGGHGQTTGDDSQLWFELEAPIHIVGVRLEMTVDMPEGEAAWGQLYWGRRGGRDPVLTENRSIGFHLKPRETSVTLWLEGTVDVLRLDPDTRIGTRFVVARIVLLAPPS